MVEATIPPVCVRRENLAARTGGLRLNLGSGDHRAPYPWVNVDQWRGPGVFPDVRGHTSALPFPDRSAGAVYCGHLLEHLEYHVELLDTLREIRRVLAYDGVACFVGPDYDRAVGNPEWHALLPGICDGGGRWPGDLHLWLSTGPRTLEAVRQVFPNAREVDIATLEGWPVASKEGWQFAICTEGG